MGAAGLGWLRVVIDLLCRESAEGGGFLAQVQACGGGGGGGSGLKVNWLCGLPGISFSPSDFLSWSVSVRDNAEFARLDKQELCSDLIPLIHILRAWSGDAPPSVSVSTSEPTSSG